MRPKSAEPPTHDDLFRARLDQIINMRHELVHLARRIDWQALDDHVASAFAEAGRPAVPSRFILGLLMLKAVYNLSDEQVCEQWIVNPYFQYFTGETFFRHDLPHERTNLTGWRNRLGAERLEALVAESLRIAIDSGALKAEDCHRITVDTTVQPKAVAYPVDARLLLTAICKLGAAARAAGVTLRQSYVRVARRAAIKAGRYAHARQFRRMKRKLDFMRRRLGRVIRDIERKSNPQDRPEALDRALSRATLLLDEQSRTRGRTVFSWHAEEVECIGKGKARTPWEFGVKASVATTNARSPGGMFVLAARALPGKPYDGHTLRGAVADVERITGIPVSHVYVDKGYAGHGLDPSQGDPAVFKSGARRGVAGRIARELRRRPAIEPIIGHMKDDGHLGRCFLKGAEGDAVNVVMSAVGQNLRLLLAWFKAFLRALLQILLGTLAPSLQDA
jgi:IS5 family transposase